MKKSQLRQLVREVLNEYEKREIAPGITLNDEGEYDVSPGVGLELYDRHLRGKSTIGHLVNALTLKGIPEDQALKVAYAIEDKYSKRYNKRF